MTVNDETDDVALQTTNPKYMKSWIIILCLIFCALCYGGWVYYEINLDVQCAIRLARGFYPFIRAENHLLTFDEYENRIINERKGQYFKCPACDREYIYRPVEILAGDDLCPSGTGPKIIAWCPLHCHDHNKRYVLGATGGSFMISEKAFQNAIINDFCMQKEDINSKLTFITESEINIPDKPIITVNPSN